MRILSNYCHVWCFNEPAYCSTVYALYQNCIMQCIS